MTEKGDIHDCPDCEKHCIQCKCANQSLARWCQCHEWKNRYWTLQNHIKLSNCPFCGTALQKTLPTKL